MKKVLMVVLSFIFLFSTVSCKCNKKEMVTLVDEQYDEQGRVEKLTSYDKLAELYNAKSNFVFYMYGATCSGCHKFTPILEEYVAENGIVIYAIEVMTLKEANPEIVKTLRYTPAVAIIKDGELYEYICGNCEGQADYFRDKEGFATWFESLVTIK